MPLVATLPGNIFTLLGLQKLPAERRVAMLDKMTELVQKRVILRLVESLSSEDAAAAEKLADQPEKLLGFLMAKGNSMGDMLAEEVERVKAEMIASVSGAA